MQEVYWYDFETKQCILCELEEESNASLEDYEDPPAAREDEDASDNDDLSVTRRRLVAGLYLSLLFLT